ncbi:MAG TPA: S-layer homology domain-containing protein, partial [Chloroflexia bacterium]
MDKQGRNKDGRSKWPVITALLAIVFLGLGMLSQMVSAYASPTAPPIIAQKAGGPNGGTSTPVPPTPCAFTPVLSEGFEGGTLGVFTNTVIVTSTTTPVPTPGWASVASNPHSGTNSAFAPDPDKTTDSRLTTINNINIPAGVSTATLTFWHRFAFENQFDGGVLEVSTDGGTWTDADANIQQGGYNGTITVFQGCITAGTPPPWPNGKRVWTNSQATYSQVSVNLLPYAGTDMKFRFRLGTDCSVSNTGWNVDDVVVSYSGVGCATVTGTPISTMTVMATNTLTSTPVLTATNTPAPTSTLVVSGTLTSTPTRTATPIPTATSTRIATATPVRGAISGRAYLRTHTAGQEAVHASVFACTSSRSFCSASVWTDSHGDYLVTNLIPGTYDIIANPPSGYNLVPNGPWGIVVNQGQTVTGQDVVFPDPIPLPPGVSVQPSWTAAGGVPGVNWTQGFKIKFTGCPGGTGTYQVHSNGQLIKSGAVTEGPAGTYTADIPSLFPLHGVVVITMVIHCPDGTTITIKIMIYIDPSGVVQSYLPNGDPAALPLATVTLFRSDNPTGPFDVVPDGSALMSPGNRDNPDLTILNGHFGWDVVPGYYMVRAEKAGCAKPGDPTQPYVDSYIMEIPPPVTDLDLRLDCGSPTFTDVHTNDYFYNAVTYLAAIGVVSGYSTGAQCPTGTPCFLPYNNVTRGQAAKFIANSVGLADEIPPTQQTFEDVDPTTNVFWVYIERMAQHGYIVGYQCGGPGEDCMPGNRPYFRWGNNITRNQLSKILVLSNQYDLTSPSDPHFQDVAQSNTFYSYVETAYEKGLISGYPCGGPSEPCATGNKPYLRGGANATRGQL